MKKNVIQCLFLIAIFSNPFNIHSQTLKLFGRNPTSVKYWLPAYDIFDGSEIRYKDFMVSNQLNSVSIYCVFDNDTALIDRISYVNQNGIEILKYEDIEHQYLSISTFKDNKLTSIISYDNFDTISKTAEDTCTTNYYYSENICDSAMINCSSDIEKNIRFAFQLYNKFGKYIGWRKYEKGKLVEELRLKYKRNKIIMLIDGEVSKILFTNKNGQVEKVYLYTDGKHLSTTYINLINSHYDLTTLNCNDNSLNSYMRFPCFEMIKESLEFSYEETRPKYYTFSSLRQFVEFQIRAVSEYKVNNKWLIIEENYIEQDDAEINFNPIKYIYKYN